MNRKRIFIGRILLAVFALALLSLTVGAVDLPEPSKSFYVLDQSDVIDSGTEDYIVSKNAELYKETGAQIVVVTQDFVPDGDLELYAYNLFNKWGVGSVKGEQRHPPAPVDRRRRLLVHRGQGARKKPDFRHDRRHTRRLPRAGLRVAGL